MSPRTDGTHIREVLLLDPGLLRLGIRFKALLKGLAQAKASALWSLGQQHQQQQQHQVQRQLCHDNFQVQLLQMQFFQMQLLQIQLQLLQLQLQTQLGLKNQLMHLRL